MTDRFDKFTERARRTLSLAQEEAAGRGHNYIGTEHLLLALVGDEKNLGARALVSLGVQGEAVRAAVDGLIAPGGAGSTIGEIGLTPRGKKSLALGVDEARRLNHHYIGTEHLLLGLLRVEDGIGAEVLRGLGVTLDSARTEVLRLLAQSPPEESPVAGVWAKLLGQGERETKRYNLAMPDALFQDVQELADRQGTTVVELIRRFIKLGLLATEIQARPDAALLIREGDREREIILL